MNWVTATDTVIWCDVISIFIFYMWIRMLKGYEKLHREDRQNESPKIEDYTVCVKDIPVSARLYNNQPDLLKAMVSLHFSELARKLFKSDKVPKPEARELGQISSIHFGF